LFVTSMIGCEKSRTPSSEVEKPTSARNAKIPVEVSYPIISDQEEYNTFNKERNVGVRLNMKVSPEVLREIALEVKSIEKHQYERTFISFYLPENMSVDKTAWASCHFDPTLKVEIRGLTLEEEATLRKVLLTHPGTKVGAWLIDSQYISRIILIYEDGGVVKKVDHTLDGSLIMDDMIELPSEKGRRFKKVKGNDIYEVDESGTLRIFDRDGLIYKAITLD
jgi:hypothetical protein